VKKKNFINFGELQKKGVQNMWAIKQDNKKPTMTRLTNFFKWVFTNDI
jgi:hypothetical protein